MSRYNAVDGRGAEAPLPAGASVRIRGLIFDFDGLILDTESPEFQSWRETYEAHGCSLPLSVWAGSIGTGVSSIAFDPYAYLEAQLGRPIDRQAIRLRRRQRYAELLEGRSLMPGVRDYVLDAGRLRLRLGVASSSPRAWVEGHLTRLGLAAHFDCVRCGDDVGRTKPDPEVYLSVLRTLDLPADQAIALEDSPNGVLAAKRAGIRCVAVPGPLTRELAFDQADLLLSSLADLSLERLLSRIEGEA